MKKRVRPFVHLCKTADETDADGVAGHLGVIVGVAVICASGQRAAVGASLVSRHGAEHVIHVVGGGVRTWEREGGAVERG